MAQIPHSHPLDKLISDDRLFLLEAILPFVDGPMRMPLIIYLKMMELQQIMRVINNQSYVRQCDFNRDFHNQNDILASLAQCGFPDIADQMKNMQQAMNMMQVMNDMSRTDSAFSDFQSIFQAYDQTVQAAPDNTSISTDTEYTNNNPYRGTEQMRKFTIPPHMKTRKILIQLISHHPNIATIPWITSCSCYRNTTRTPGLQSNRSL